MHTNGSIQENGPSEIRLHDSYLHESLFLFESGFLQNRGEITPDVFLMISQVFWQLQNTEISNLSAILISHDNH